MRQSRSTKRVALLTVRLVASRVWVERPEKAEYVHEIVDRAVARGFGTPADMVMLYRILECKLSRTG